MFDGLHFRAAVAAAARISCQAAQIMPSLLPLDHLNCVRACSAKNPSGEDINALEQHIKNLLTPSTPDFFNTLVRRPGSD